MKECPPELSESVIGAAIEVHKELGAGLLESVYEKALEVELSNLGLGCRLQVEVPAKYKGRDLGLAFRADIVVEGCLVLELKSIAQTPDIATAQLISYLKLLKIRRGLILNFGQTRLVDGIKRISI